MSVVWGVVYDHEGGIDVMSEKDVGTRFDIYLPATGAPLPKQAGSSPISRLKGSGQKILVVDDMTDQQELTAAALDRLNYQSETCTTGREALEAMAQQHFDLIILDMVTDDDWDGLKTFQEIKERFPDAKTLLVSGFAETDDVRRAQELGAGPFLRKPFTLESLGRLIKTLL